ncbi:MAG: hypothetical protein WCH86_04140 [Kiritimatiellales bacterium]
MKIIDNDTGQLIPQAIVVPRYTDLTSGDIFIAHAFVYNQGDRFCVYQPKGLVLVFWPFAWFGKDIRTDGYVIAAKGYEPSWSHLNGHYESDFRMRRRVLLNPCNKDNTICSSFLEDIGKTVIRIDHENAFSIAPHSDVEIRNELSPDELRRICIALGEAKDIINSQSNGELVTHTAETE